MQQRLEEEGVQEVLSWIRSVLQISLLQAQEHVCAKGAPSQEEMP